MIPFFRKLSWLRQRGRRESELREELEHHLEEEAEQRQAEGLPKAAARRAACVDLGNFTAVQENTREAWGWPLAEQFVQDMRYAARSMGANRLFTATAVISLALGIGANTALYSFVESMLLRPLPAADPESLVLMKWRAPVFPPVVKGFSMVGTMTNRADSGTMSSVFPYPALRVFQSNPGILASMFCYTQAAGLNVTIREQTEVLDGQYVSGEYFPGMGVVPEAGRLLVPGDDRPGAAAVVVLNYRYSGQRFGEAARGLGETIRINDKPFMVVGVAPRGFFGADPAAAPDVWLPMHANLLLDAGATNAGAKFLDRNFYWTVMMGRLRPGVSVAQAQATLEPQFRRFVEASATSSAELEPLPRLMVTNGATGMDSLSQSYSRPLFVMVAMAGLILLIACANISNLLLGRAMARRREVAVRLSLGAGRMRIVRQLLTESILLACVGGALGLPVAFSGIRFLTVLLGAGQPNFTLRAELNWHVLSVAFALSVFTGLLFGLAPALQATRGALIPALKELRNARYPLGRLHMGRFLLAGQIALSLLLLVAAGLFGRTLTNLHSIDLGFHPENVLLFSLKPPAAYEGAALKRVYREVREGLERIPGVQGASLSNAPLLSGSGSLTTAAQVVGAAQPPRGPANLVGIFRAGPEFFRTMRIPILAGREFEPRDDDGSVPPVIVNRRFARLFGLEDPIGRIVNLKPRSYRIVGVVGDALFMALKEERHPMLYFPLTSQPPRQVTFAVRALANPLEHAHAVREIVRRVDSRLAPAGLETYSTRIDRAIGQEVTLARLSTAFGCLAPIVACVGLYGTAAFHVSRRTNEIGIRTALGAQRRGIVWLVLREVFLLGVIGLAVGVAAALSGGRYLAVFLYGIRPNDPLVLSACAVMLLGAVLVAGYLPARRAASIDPTMALRHE